MGDLSPLGERQTPRIPPNFPLSRGVPRVDDRRVVDRSDHAIRNRLQ